MTDKPYYAAYENRYRTAYSQGITYWESDPRELASIHADVTAFLSDLPGGTDLRIAEFGCGECHIGEVVAAAGFCYSGFDIAESAVAKGNARLTRFGGRATATVADIVRLAGVPDAAFDAGIDSMAIHMLIADADRAAYLTNAFRVLKPGAPMLFVREAFNPDATDEPVASYDEYACRMGIDTQTPLARTAWENGRPVQIEAPIIAARARSLDQYRREVEEAGFVFGEFRTDLGWVTFRVRKP